MKLLSKQKKKPGVIISFSDLNGHRKISILFNHLIVSLIVLKKKNCQIVLKF